LGQIRLNEYEAEFSAFGQNKTLHNSRRTSPEVASITRTIQTVL
jgi:hypothetical protein